MMERVIGELPEKEITVGEHEVSLVKCRFKTEFAQLLTHK